MKTRYWIMLLALFSAVCIAFIVITQMFFQNGEYIGIYQNGKQVYTIDISSVGEPYEITLKADDGSENVVSVSKDEIKIVFADCPDQTCVKHGKLEKNAMPIICLPNKVVIQWIDDDNEYDVLVG